MLDRAKVREVLAQAASLPQSERAAYLDFACEGNAELRAEVESLLAAVAKQPEFMSAPTRGGAQTVSAEPLGTRIGPYKLMEQIGHGGFGTVYLAEQEHPVRRRVALKIIKLGMDTQAVIARFEAERQALAMMDHAHIAKVFDAGITSAEQGSRPYFVMELVRGEPINTFADQAGLTVPERLDLFIQVCQALQHAHSKGIIHRDIKPGNVLVTTQDGRPHAKVIDFGIAKATEQRLTERTFFTEFRQLIGTPEYMSPEQAGGAPDVDTRSDVYSLGVLLYELLTGATPFDPGTLRAAAYDEIQRIIREVEPPKPSTRLSRLASLANVAALRRTEPARLGAMVTGDLDWIVMKALDKDRARRYETASALAADIARHLAGDPVDAVPPSTGYKMRKFVRRHRGAVIACFAIMGVLVLGIVGTTSGMLSAWKAQRVAQSQRDLAATVRTFLAQTFQGVSPHVARGRNTELLGALMDNAAARIEAGELKDNPAAERELRLVIASVYSDIARIADARRVLAPFEAEANGLKTQAIEALLLRAQLAITSSELDAAEAILLAAKDKLDGSTSPDASSRANVLGGLARVALERLNHARAIELEELAVASAREVKPLDPELLSRRLLSLGVTSNKASREEAALAAWAEALNILNAPQSQDSPTRVELLVTRAALHAQQLKAELASKDLEESLRIGKRIFPPAHPALLQAQYALANIRLHAGEFDQALVEFETLLAMRRAHHGPDSLDVAQTLSDIASMHYMFGRYQQALDAAAECEAIRAKLLTPRDLAASDDWTTISGSLSRIGRIDEALQLARSKVEAQRQFVPPSSDAALQGLMALMQCLLYAEQFEECAQVGRSILELCAKDRPNDAPIWLYDTQLATAAALLGQADPHLAPEAESLLRACLDDRQRRLGDKNVRVATIRVTLGRAIAAQVTHAIKNVGLPSDPSARTAIVDRFREAEALLVDNFQSQVDTLARIPAPVRRMRIEGPAETLADLYDTWDTVEPGTGKATSATEWRTRLATLRAQVDESMKSSPN